jgi:ABC-2 type transport system permease protein
VPPTTGGGAPPVATPIVLVLQFTSGVFFVFTQLPEWMQVFASIFPLKWLAQAMRSVFLPEEAAAMEVAGSWELGMCALMLALWCVIGLVAALVFFRWTPRGSN